MTFQINEPGADWEELPPDPQQQLYDDDGLTAEERRQVFADMSPAQRKQFGDCRQRRRSGRICMGENMKPDYERDGVQLFCGDCREILPHLGEIDAVVTDPPYGIGYIPQKHNTRQSRGNRTFGKEDVLFGDTGRLDFDARDIYERYKNNPQIWWGGNYYADSFPRTKGWLVWYKAHGMENASFSHAEIAWTNLEQPVRGINHLWMGQCRASENGVKNVHPTQKPIQIMCWCIRFLPDSCSLILDPFMGSGTTGVACVKLGRRFIGVELERKYFDIAVKRIEKAVEDQALFEPLKEEYQQGFLI